MVLLVTSDNEQFTTDKDIVERSVLIKNMLEGTTQSLVNDLVLTRTQYRCWRVRSANSSA